MQLVVEFSRQLFFHLDVLVAQPAVFAHKVHGTEELATAAEIVFPHTPQQQPQKHEKDASGAPSRGCLRVIHAQDDAHENRKFSAQHRKIRELEPKDARDDADHERQEGVQSIDEHAPEQLNEYFARIRVHLHVAPKAHLLVDAHDHRECHRDEHEVAVEQDHELHRVEPDARELGLAATSLQVECAPNGRDVQQKRDKHQDIGVKPQRRATVCSRRIPRVEQPERDQEADRRVRDLLERAVGVKHGREAHESAHVDSDVHLLLLPVIRLELELDVAVDEVAEPRVEVLLHEHELARDRALGHDLHGAPAEPRRHLGHRALGRQRAGAHRGGQERALELVAV